MQIIFKYFWLFLIVLTAFNALMYWVRSRPHAALDPSLKSGYRKLILGYLFVTNLPLIILGAGCVVGDVRSVFEVFRPRDGNPFVLGFWAAIVIEWVFLTYWLFAGGGAEMIVKHPGFMTRNIET